MKIVLLNPPGDELYIRSYYCGSTSKANYLFQPIDLLVLSGIIAREHEVAVIDSIAERLDADRTIRALTAHRPDAVICIVSMVSWDSDLPFLYRMKERFPSLIVIASGDLFFEDPEDILRAHKCIDAVIFDFISDNVLSYLKGDAGHISGMIYRKGDTLVVKNKVAHSDALFSIPIPKHELFMNRNYRFPFVRHYPFTTVLTNFGCPFQCTFCIANVLGFRYRKAAEVMEELRYIKKLNIKEIFFEDMSFGLPRENAVRLCAAMASERLGFGWTCFSRADLLDRELLTLMKASGCHTVMLGVESASEKFLSTYRKGYTKAQVVEAFKLCRKMGVRTVGTFILGLPDDTMGSCLETIRFARELDCDYASFNIAVPRAGTELRATVLREGLIKKSDIVFNLSGPTVSTISRHLSNGQLKALRKRALREFYLRPSHVLNMVKKIRTFTELKEHVWEFFALFRTM